MFTKCHLVGGGEVGEGLASGNPGGETPDSLVMYVSLASRFLPLNMMPEDTALSKGRMQGYQGNESAPW